MDLGKNGKGIDYRVRTEEMGEAIARFPMAGATRTRVGIQVRASSLARTYPISGIAHISQALLNKNCEVFLLGAPGDVPKQTKVVPYLQDMTRQGLTFRQSCAIVNMCDVVIAPDSALLHVAGALGVPAVGMYGPFPRELRTKYAKNTWVFEGDEKRKAPCQPCFHHMNQARQDHFPENCPTAAAGVCGVMASIDADRVVQKALQIARKRP